MGKNEKNIKEKLTKNKNDKCISVRGDNIVEKLDEDIENKSLLGIMEKIALQVFRDNPNTEKVTVTYRIKEKTYPREEFKEELNEL
ncbi:MAG: hypothetical protein ACOCP8_03865 [archaeon]